MIKKSFIVLFFTLLISVFATKAVFSVSLDDCENGSKDSGCIDLLQKKIDDLGNQKKTLSSQITQFNSQIQVTQLKIADAQATVDKLEKEIGALSARIGNINQSVDKLEGLLKERIVATYQQSFVSDLEIILTSSDFSDFILRAQYLKQVQENDKKILTNLQETKSNYANQKDERETKQAQVAASKKQLEGLKASLDSEKAQKQALLVTTQNDETKFQALLSQVQAEQAISFGGGSESFIRDVHTGDSIGSIASWGASAGCSSGPHLHFEVHKDGSIQDPNNYLQSTSYQYNYPDSEQSVYGSVNPHGNLPWPIDGPIYINQGFGAQKNSFIYGSAGHLGIDMQSGAGSAAGENVKAVKDGKLYGGSIQCGGAYPGSLFYARIKHDDSLDTLYLHMIPH
ncbi:hypothetical protein HY024_00530 [Candidatus Curtissbacteria bacterium]|nr:hypothetical protein [Candidatus Curtissbacteria bacterium]